MLRAALNISWSNVSMSNKDLYGKIPKITDTIREQRLRFSGHCWRSINEVVSDVLLRYTHTWTKISRTPRQNLRRSANGRHELQLRRATKRNDESSGMESTCQSMPSNLDFVR